MQKALGQFVAYHTGDTGFGTPKDEHKVAELARGLHVRSYRDACRTFA